MKGGKKDNSTKKGKKRGGGVADWRMTESSEARMPSASLMQSERNGRMEGIRVL